MSARPAPGAGGRSSASTNKTAPAGIAEYTTRAGSHGKLTRKVPPSTVIIFMPIHAVSAKKPMTRALRSRNKRGGAGRRSRSTSLGNPMLRAMQRRQRRAVKGKPGQQHRGHFVVPDQRVADLAQDGGNDDQNRQRSNDGDDDRFQETPNGIAQLTEGWQEFVCGKRPRPLGSIVSALFGGGGKRGFDHLASAGNLGAELRE